MTTVKDSYTTKFTLAELQATFPDEFIRISTINEFWPAGLLAEAVEASHSTTIQIGWPRGEKWEADTLSQAMGLLHSAASLCAECSQNVDNTGLCVMDAGHRGYRRQI